VDILLELVKTYGLFAALAAVVIWWGARQIMSANKERKEANALAVKRLQATEDWIRGTLVGLNDRSTQALADVTNALRDQAATNRDIIKTNREILIALRGRPCMTGADLPETPAQPPTEPIVRKGRDHA
jgi:hypothetical protein